MYLVLILVYFDTNIRVEFIIKVRYKLQNIFYQEFLDNNLGIRTIGD